MDAIDAKWIRARLTGRRGELARLAEALDLDASEISRILKGERKVQAEEIPRLLAFFDGPAGHLEADRMTEASERLKALREAAGYRSAADAARKLGWNLTTYSAHENGNRGITAEAAGRYGRAFGVRPEYILFGVNGELGNPGPDLPSVSARLKSLRERAGLSVRAMADELEMPPSTYTHYEDRYKRNHLGYDLTSKIADVLTRRGVPRDEVMILSGASAADAPNEQNDGNSIKLTIVDDTVQVFATVDASTLPELIRRLQMTLRMIEQAGENRRLLTDEDRELFRHGDESREATSWRLIVAFDCIGMGQREVGDIIGRGEASISSQVSGRQYPSRVLSSYLFREHGIDWNFIAYGETGSLASAVAERLVVSAISLRNERAEGTSSD